MLGVGGTVLTDLRRELLGRDQLAVTAFRSVTINARNSHGAGLFLPTGGQAGDQLATGIPLRLSPEAPNSVRSWPRSRNSAAAYARTSMWRSYRLSYRLTRSPSASKDTSPVHVPHGTQGDRAATVHLAASTVRSKSNVFLPDTTSRFNSLLVL